MPIGDTEWMAHIQRGRSYGLTAKKSGYSVPIVPWIHPPLDADLQQLIRNIGIRKTLEKGMQIFSQYERISQLTLVEKGVTARHFGNNATIGGKAAAVSVPGHLACGNLNFFTGRPAFGTYCTLTKAELLFCPQNILLPILHQDTSIGLKLCQHMECCALSDRIGFAAMLMLPVELKMKCFDISWAIHFGKAFSKDNHSWVGMPIPLTRMNRCLLANSSSVSVDNVLKKWKDDNIWCRTDDWVEFRVEAFEDAYQWMREAEEPSLFNYPKTLNQFFEIFD